MIDNTFKNAALYLLAKYKPETVERHWDRYAAILSWRRAVSRQGLAA